MCACLCEFSVLVIVASQSWVDRLISTTCCFPTDELHDDDTVAIIPESAESECVPILRAAADAGLSTLSAALEASGMVENVTEPSAPVTVLAPSNEAFEAAVAAFGMTLEELLGNTQFLTGTLLYHILPKAFTAEEFGQGGTFETTLGNASYCGVSAVDVMNGDVITIVGGQTNATVTVADVETCTGIVHVIDFVLQACTLEGRNLVENKPAIIHDQFRQWDFLSSHCNLMYLLQCLPKRKLY